MRGLQSFCGLRNNLEARLQWNAGRASFRLAPAFEILTRNVLFYEIKRRIIEMNLQKFDNVLMFTDALPHQTEQRDLSFECPDLIQLKTEFENAFFVSGVSPQP